MCSPPPSLAAVHTILGSRSQCAAGAACVPEMFATGVASTWAVSLPFGEGGHPPAAALVPRSAVRQAVSGARLVDPPHRIRRNQRDHHRHQIDAALVAHDVHVVALINKS
jgi:hypothetical protein